jgi:outer membrane protein assembly factor BamB
MLLLIFIRAASMWAAPAGPYLQSIPAAGSKRNTLYCLDAEHGTVDWTFSTSGSIMSNPSPFRGSVIFGCDDDTLYRLAME